MSLKQMLSHLSSNSMAQSPYYLDPCRQLARARQITACYEAFGNRKGFISVKQYQNLFEKNPNCATGLVDEESNLVRVTVTMPTGGRPLHRNFACSLRTVTEPET
jgi:hypothetical protein